ncbi:aminoacyl-tRNA deacylase [Nitratireductor soli]|uniref:aminoacyl-tRNA deacylase n=1 Tax=Nitratireductor soli TaxID=1670619 RepID=UPI001FCD7052|nr:YbaK/EbsC family protein [Nitratireductor soli]
MARRRLVDDLLSAPIVPAAEAETAERARTRRAREKVERIRIMGIAMTMHEFLEDNHVPYDIARHARTGNSTMTARVSHVPGKALAKGVVLKWDGGYMLAVLPASRQVDLGKVGEIVGEKVELASEEEAARLFPDCEEGAVPVFGVPYRIASMLDEDLEMDRDIYFEGGDHRTLVHVTGAGFERLMYGMPRGRISA